MNDIQEDYLSWYNDLRDNTIEEAEEWSTRDDEDLEKWALYEEYKTFEDAYYEYESDWVKELREKWEEHNDENKKISFAMSFKDFAKEEGISGNNKSAKS